jgi:hypothetical protein
MRERGRGQERRENEPIESCATTSCLLTKEWWTTWIMLNMLVLTPTSKDPSAFRDDKIEMLTWTALGLALASLGLIVELVFLVSVTTREVEEGE